MIIMAHILAFGRNMAQVLTKPPRAALLQVRLGLNNWGFGLTSQEMEHKRTEIEDRILIRQATQGIPGYKAGDTPKLAHFNARKKAIAYRASWLIYAGSDRAQRSQDQRPSP